MGEDLTELADQFLEEWEPLDSQFANTEEAYINGVYNFSDWLKQKNGKLPCQPPQNSAPKATN